MPKRTRTTHIVVHTCADTRKEGGEHVDTPPEDVIAWHTDPKPRGRGWSHVGYHWLIRKSGEEHELLDERMKGIHCRDQGMNHKALGVSFSGHGGDDYWDIYGEPWTEAQEATGIARIVALCRKYSIPAKNVIGHRETGAKKACPGDRIDMKRVRQLVATALGETVTAAPSRPLLRRGDIGKAVGEAQAVLKRLGLYTGRVDDDFGPRMEAAVKAFQRARGLSADGVVGQNTWAALLAS